MVSWTVGPCEHEAATSIPTRSRAIRMRARIVVCYRLLPGALRGASGCFQLEELRFDELQLDDSLRSRIPRTALAISSASRTSAMRPTWSSQVSSGIQD